MNACCAPYARIDAEIIETSALRMLRVLTQTIHGGTEAIDL